MQFVSLDFLAFVAISLLCFHATESPSVKRVVLLVSNVVFAGALAANPHEMLPITLFLAAGFVLVRAVARWRHRTVLVVAIAGPVAAFAHLKHYTSPFLFGTLGSPYSVVGLSYLLFRILHLIIDSYEDPARARITPLQYVNYCCFFPAWLSGPIQRYEDWAAQESRMDATRLDGADVRAALSRIVTGLFRIAVVSSVIFAGHEVLATIRLDARHPVHYCATLASAATLYTLYMYFNFAGYMDVAIGVAGLYGFRLPENFRQPFRSGSMLEFWSRWHITLSSWFHAYLFNPLLRALTRRFGARSAGPYLGVAAYLVTFTVMGTWHGPTGVFLVYGLILGLTGAGNKLYEVELRRVLGRERVRELYASPVYSALCRGAVFATFSGALICFWAPPHLLRAILAHPLLVALALAGLTVAASGVLAAGRALRTAWDAVARYLPAPSRTPALEQLLLASRAYAVLLLIAVERTSIPTFVYVPF